LQKKFCHQLFSQFQVKSLWKTKSTANLFFTKKAIMKLSVAVFASLASVASARLSVTNLLLNSYNNEKHGESYDARIIIGGLRHDVSKTDLKTIEQSAVAAYNDVFNSVGFGMEGVETQSSVPLDSMSWNMDEALERPARCRLCNPNIVTTVPDPAHSELIFVGVDWYTQGSNAAALHGHDDDAQVYMAFEETFCSKLRASGSANLVNAKDCTFSFFENPGSAGTKMTTPVKSAYDVSITGAAVTEVQVTMMGVLHDFSEADRELINQSILAAHREAFAGTDYSLKSFNMVGDLDVPVALERPARCRLCNPDAVVTGAGGADIVTLITAVAVAADHNNAELERPARCRLCNPNIVATVIPAASMHEAFEKTVCTKLNISGFANFANVHDCSFRFVDTPIIETAAVAHASLAQY
jgi:hypothetical protein